MKDTDLILITDRRRTEGRLMEVVRECLDAGLGAVMFREKDLEGGELFESATVLREITSNYGAGLIVNDRVDVALAVGADGVHLGTRSFSPQAVRNIIPEKMIVGVSAHNIEEAKEAGAGGADYITLSPVFVTSSKPGAEPLGIEGMKNIIERIDVPVYALGGIDHNNIVGVVEAGARGIALIGAILDSPDPGKATGALLKSLEGIRK